MDGWDGKTYESSSLGFHGILGHGGDGAVIALHGREGDEGFEAAGEGQLEVVDFGWCLVSIYVVA
jgi:hypothetical protein